MKISLVKEVLASGFVNQNAAPISDLTILYGNLIPLILGVAGIVLFLMLLLGGFKYITSGGDPKAAESARKTITYSIAGIILISAAYFIMLFIYALTSFQGCTIFYHKKRLLVTKRVYKRQL